jgi:ADP-ribosylglycohydrolase
MHPLFKIVLNDLKTDVEQMLEEGHDPAALSREVEAAAATGSLDALVRLQEDLWNRPSPASFAYQEPSDWESISRGFPDAQSHERFGGDTDALGDRLLAAWQGRCAGCQLGKPVEGAWPEVVKKLCQESDSWPLTDYVKPVENPQRLAELARIDGYGKRFVAHQGVARGRFDCVAPDDDIQYAIVGLLTLEKHGVDFTGDQAIAMLRAVNPQGMLWSAGLSMVQKSGFGIGPPYTALFGNPCRQSLGAQIRCDPFGWAAPANPALAARLAYRDAANSQTRNGIYSGIFFAVAMADAFSHGDPAAAIATAEQYVPPRSRFAEMIRFVRQVCREHDDWQAANAALYARYDQEVFAPGQAPANHSVINAGIVIMAILKGAGDFTRTVGISVMAGRDTDCNGATAGSIMGCALGTAGIPRHWTAPLNDTIRTELCGMHVLKISDLARRTLELSKNHVRQSGPVA